LLTAVDSPLAGAVVTQSQLDWKGFYPPVALARASGYETSLYRTNWIVYLNKSSFAQPSGDRIISAASLTPGATWILLRLDRLETKLSFHRNLVTPPSAAARA
jgi:hypothetical protein